MDPTPSSGGIDLPQASSNSLTVRRDSAQPTKKRNRAAADDEASTFVATPLPPNSQSRQWTFNPYQLLARSRVPLAWIDPSPQDKRISPGCIFNASIPQFLRSSPCPDSRVLIARLCPNGGLHAIENVGGDTYVACALSPWVSEERVDSASRGQGFEVCVQELLEARLARGEDAASQKSGGVTACLPGAPGLKKPKNRRGVIARMSILPAKDLSSSEVTDKAASESISATQIGPDSAPVQQPTQTSSQSGLVGMGPDVHELPDSLDTPNADSSNKVNQPAMCEADAIALPSLEVLREQYFETLYLSKTSLAYFAKGPLARARVAAQNVESGEGRETLADFYRGMILPSKKMDLKYKESLSSHIDSLALETMEETGRKKKKSSKKPKLSKDGVYSDEVDFLSRHWRERDVSTSTAISNENNTLEKKNVVSDLRNRETKMQIVLVLEVLSLETPPPNAAIAGGKDIVPIKTEMIDPVDLVRTPQKAKNKRDLASDLDALVDKLCIWHTVGIDELLASPEKAGIDDHGRVSKSKDKLRDFCADVVIPFYASRLPERCKTICRRLGGPEVSTTKPKLLTKSASTSRLPPGATIKARPRAVPKRTLERVLSEDHSMRHSSPPILSRSSTASIVPTLKREPSESSQRPGSRGGVHKSVTFTNREIDLVADAKAHDAKRRKLARLAAHKQELDAAIDALKKPNRSKAAQAIMDDFERREGDKKPLGKREQHVQITATPKRPTSRDQWRGKFEDIPSIDVSVEETLIPSSTVRPKLSEEGFNVTHSSTTKRAVLSAIHNTPSRALFKSVRVPHASGSTELPDRVGSDCVVESTLAMNRLRPDLNIDHVEITPLRMMKSQKPVMFTPIKKADVRIEDVFRDAPMIPELVGKAMDRVMGGSVDMSIYDSLGWNDDFE